MLSPTDVHPAYAAGLVDGEGCIIARLGSKRTTSSWTRPFLVAIEVTNTYREVLVALRDSYGGRLYSKGSYSEKEKLEAWVLRVMGADCQRMASAILPYAIVKRSQIEILLEARTLLVCGGTRVCDENVRQREEIVARMAAAKTEGTVLRAVS